MLAGRRGSVTRVRSEVLITKSKLRRSSLVLLSASSLALVGASCQQGTGDQAQRLKKVETSVTQIPGVVSRLRALEGKEGPMSEQLAALQTSLTDLEAKVASFQQDVDASRGASQELKKKADDLSGRIGAVSAKTDALSGKIGPLEQKLSLLQTRYDDHLRKYHSGG